MLVQRKQFSFEPKHRCKYENGRPYFFFPFSSFSCYFFILFYSFIFISLIYFIYLFIYYFIILIYLFFLLRLAATRKLNPAPYNHKHPDQSTLPPQEHTLGRGGAPRACSQQDQARPALYCNAGGMQLSRWGLGISLPLKSYGATVMYLLSGNLSAAHLLHFVLIIFLQHEERQGPQLPLAVCVEPASALSQPCLSPASLGITRA